MDNLNNIFRNLPAMHQILASAELTNLPVSLVQPAAETSLKELRHTIVTGNHSIATSKEQLLQQIVEMTIVKVQQRLQPSLVRAINATGIIVHTNLGRAPLCDSAIKAISELGNVYCNLEFDLDSGLRGSRQVHCEKVLQDLTGAEASLVVNNNAAAVLIVLAGLASGKEVVVSRGELIEIGGSFRLPDVMEQSGAKLKEVGTTNRTKLNDYRKAINTNTAMLLKAHPSNYEIIGFTEKINIADLVEVGREKNVIVYEDCGSGSLIDTAEYGLPHEPTPRELITAGVDIVSFSGDKLLGGPQGGIIIGKAKYINVIKSHPLMRVLRPDKLTLIALDATLREYYIPVQALKNIPVLAMLAKSLDEIRLEANQISSELEHDLSHIGFKMELLDDCGYLGGGSLPMKELKTKVVAITHSETNLNRLAKGLRSYNPPIIVHIKDDSLRIDPRTLLEGESEIVIQALISVTKDIHHEQQRHVTRE